LAYKGSFESTANVDTRDIGQAVEDMKMTAKSRRRIFERRWYDNNFFDDGFHFRYLSRSSNKIVDLSERSTIYTPQRSIPKSSRQIRGIANLLMSSDPTPAVYPEPVDTSRFPDTQPQAQPAQPPAGPGGQAQPQQPQAPSPYQQEQKHQKETAQKRGYWLLNEWQTPDDSQETVLDKLALMCLLTLKHGISYLKVWPDDHEEKVQTAVRDAFDVYVLGNYTNIYQAPFMIDSVPMLISEIKANPLFDEKQLEGITPDNRKASSEIKEAYLQARYGRDTTSDQSATLILNEAFVKEYVTKQNIDRIRAQEDGEAVLKKIKGDSDDVMGKPIIRQVYTAGGIWLYDQYTNLSKYPYVDYRIEPGPLYQVPMIERFMPANKSLDSVVSRVERYTHTMVTGSWLKRRGENFKINNIAGGQVIEYDATAPVQNQIAPIPPFVYEFIGLLTNFIEEQGVSTTTLGKLPAGVKANAAIESLKESEYANLILATRRLNAACKKIARMYFECADEYFVSPHKVTFKNKGDVLNFSVIGKSALTKRKALKIDTPDGLVSISKDTPIDIEVEQGMAYTKEGQKATMQEVINSMIQGVQAGAIPATALQSVWQKYLETYQFGATEEFMQDLDKAMQGGASLSDQQILQMKTALLESLKEAGEVGPEADQTKVQTTKIGVLEALHQSGLAKKVTDMATPPAKESISIAYKDAPEDIKRQMEQEAGFQPSRQQSPVATDQAIDAAKLIAEQQRSDADRQSSERVATSKVNSVKSKGSE
jgi:hypothetical protein